MKRIGLAAIAVALALVAVAVILPWAVPESTVRFAVAREIHALTGRMPKIGGQARLRLLPYPSVVVERISIPGLTEGRALLDADSLEASLRLPPLLLGRIEIGSVALRRPSLDLLVDPAGRRSWAFSEGAFADAARGRPNLPVPLGSLRFIGGTVTHSDARTGTVAALVLTDATIAWSERDGSLSASGTVGWRGQTIDISLAVEDPATLLKGEPSDFRGRLECDILRATASGRLAGDGRFEGKVGLTSSSLSEVFGWVGFRLGAGLNIAGFKLQSPATIDSRTVSLPDAQLEVDGNLAEGAVMMKLDGPRPRLSATLAADTLNVTPLTGNLDLHEEASARWREDAIDLGALTLADLDLRISAGATRIGNARLGRVAAAAVIKDGAMELSLGEATGYGGTMSGRIALATPAGVPSVAATLSFEGVEMSQALSDVFGFRKLEGAGQGRLDVTAAGSTFAELVDTLSGSANLEVASGALIGVDLVELMRRIERRPLSIGFEPRSGRTSFDRAAVTFAIAEGVARTTDARLEGPALLVGLGGKAGVARRELDLAGEATLVATGDDSPPFRLPFKIRGGWEWPMVEPDPEALIRRSGAAAPLLRGLKSFTADGQAQSPPPSVGRSLTP